MADDDVAWAAGDTGIFVTTNGGRGWRTVTPPNLDDIFPSEHIGSMDAVGKNDLWLVLVDVPGLVPYSQSTNGSDRGGGIDRSTNGGQSWSFSALPGCIQSCGAALFLSFVDPDHGFAAVGPDLSGPTVLFSTADGGVTWTPKGDIPDLGSILSGGPGPEPQLVFTSPLDGWAVTGPAFGVDDQMTSPGGVVYRTTDGGSSWSVVSGLPSTNHYELPTFFGTQDGVVLSNAEGVAGRPTGVYVTEDGGSTWTARPTPDIPGLREFKPSGLRFRFAPISATSWKIDVGSALYSTTNAGRTWVRTLPTPKVTAGTTTAVVFVSSRDGLALWSGPPKCEDRVHAPEASQCFPTMVGTTDGGNRWAPVTP
ncbi:MAG: WD40/YVTN/BNR-like repeat-containing protein [Acidimicrobiales bacterium]